MSTLTKVLIVLLTISSIFLSGIVVTYVGNAVNYKEESDNLRTQAQSDRREAENANTNYNDLKVQTEREKEQLNAQITALNTQLTQLQSQLNNANRDKDQLLQNVNTYTTQLDSFRQTNETQTKYLEEKEADVKRINALLTECQSNLKETSTSLLEKTAIVKQQTDIIKQLNTEKMQLQARLDKYMQQYGQTTVTSVPRTQYRDNARPIVTTPPATQALPTRNIGLKGLITRLDMNNSYAEISIGRADGVKENMIFHVTRGDEYICDILITNVDTDTAVGILDRVQQPLPPKRGDNVSTNL